MAEARSRDQWNHTAHILCLIANVNRDPKKSRPFKPAMFHPYYTTKHKGNVVSADRWWDAVVAEGQRRKMDRWIPTGPKDKSGSCSTN